MGNTYTQLYAHIVFTVRNRASLILELHRNELEKYICGIATNLDCKVIAIYCNSDHTHILLGYKPTYTISNIVRDVKANSSKFINDRKWVKGRFEWQDGYGAFSYSKSQIETVKKYILNQKKHHQKKSFREEYIELLHKYEITFDEKYLFDWIQ